MYTNYHKFLCRIRACLGHRVPSWILICGTGFQPGFLTKSPLVILIWLVCGEALACMSVYVHLHICIRIYLHTHPHYTLFFSPHSPPRRPFNTTQMILMCSQGWKPLVKPVTAISFPFPRCCFPSLPTAAT